MFVLVLLACAPTSLPGEPLPSGRDAAAEGPADLRAAAGSPAASREPVSASVSFSGSTTISGASGYACRLGHAGDVNGDGYADLLVVDCAADRVDVHLGGAAGLSTTPVVSLAAGPASFGDSVDGGGDVNGDGYDDVIVGGPEARSGAGCAWVYYGGPAGPDNTWDWRKCGTSAANKLGGHVAVVGDGNGDGYAEVAVAPDQGGTGRVSVFAGSATGPGSAAAFSASPNGFGSYYGESLRGAGDVDGDGYDDIVYGGPYKASNRGVVRVWYGSATGYSSGATTVYNGTSNLMNLGLSVDGAGDVDGDGYDDVLAGAPGETYCTTMVSGYGFALVIHGSATGLDSSRVDTIQGYLGNDANCTMGGWSVGGGGDYDADGLADPLLGQSGMWLWSSGVIGSAKVFLGNAAGVPQLTSNLEDWRVTGTAHMGNSVVAVGDVDGDGCDDLAASQGYQLDYGYGPVYEVQVHYASCGGGSTSPPDPVE